jgi:DNA-binding NtrC family response regulator
VAEAKKLLIAEDEPRTREGWRELIGSWGFQVAAAADGEQALQLVRDFEPHILLLDLKLPRLDGLGVLARLREQNQEVHTIVASGEGEIPDAVKAIKLGAYDYLRKPVDIAHLKVALQNLCELLAVSDENKRLRRQLMQNGGLGPLVGESKAMRALMALIEQVASSDASVIIVGESGTGKELVARTIHNLSARRKGPYMAVNCAAMPEALMESELFGHEKGAFTGAERRREGCFELADGGSLLLDEITEMKIDLQAKLLRVLEERVVKRVGGNVNIPFDVRVMAASNRDVAVSLRERQLREDLYYRLNVFTIELPPLRNRHEDIQLLAESFLREFAAEAGKTLSGLDDECLATLRGYSWPGNVRQLRNVIKRATVLTNTPLLTVADLPAELRAPAARSAAAPVPQVGRSLDDVERDLIFETLDAVGGNKARAAEILGISLKTLYNRLDRYRGKDNRADS